MFDNIGETVMGKRLNRFLAVAFFAVCTALLFPARASAGCGSKCKCTTYEKASGTVQAFYGCVGTSNHKGEEIYRGFVDLTIILKNPGASFSYNYKDPLPLTVTYSDGSIATITKDDVIKTYQQYHRCGKQAVLSEFDPLKSSPYYAYYDEFVKAFYTCYYIDEQDNCNGHAWKQDNDDTRRAYTHNGNIDECYAYGSMVCTECGMVRSRIGGMTNKHNWSEWIDLSPNAGVLSSFNAAIVGNLTGKLNDSGYADQYHVKYCKNGIENLLNDPTGENGCYAYKVEEHHYGEWQGERLLEIG